ncbi:hypothetical protein KKJ19_10850 [Xenorhabdus bovienii]|nr:hypothetical protein [Xenorhabdus bovienii]
MPLLASAESWKNIWAKAPNTQQLRVCRMRQYGVEPKKLFGVKSGD